MLTLIFDVSLNVFGNYLYLCYNIKKRYGYQDRYFDKIKYIKLFKIK